MNAKKIYMRYVQLFIQENTLYEYFLRGRKILLSENIPMKRENDIQGTCFDDKNINV